MRWPAILSKHFIQLRTPILIMILNYFFYGPPLQAPTKFKRTHANFDSR